MAKTINDYPMQKVARDLPDHIMWIFTGEYRMLDNFAPTPVKVDIGFGERVYQTSEHAFAAAKAAERTDHDLVAGAPNPGIAKGIGRSIPLREDWEEVKYDVMWRVLIAKFRQHPKAFEILQSTGTRKIYEGNSWNDDTWGVIKKGTYRHYKWHGRNALGEMLMEIRDNPDLLK